MPNRNYGFEKRQKELRRQAKKEAKQQKKLERAKQPGEPMPDEVEPPAGAPPSTVGS